MSKNAGYFMQVVGPPDVCARHGKDHMAVMLNQKGGGLWAGGGKGSEGACVIEPTEPVYVCVACIEAGAHARAPMPTEVEDRLSQVRAQLRLISKGQIDAWELLDLLEAAIRVRAGVALNGQEIHDVSVALDSAEKTWKPPMVREVSTVGQVTRACLICPRCDAQFGVDVDCRPGKVTEAYCHLCLERCRLSVVDGSVQIVKE
jgi:hypothetical protein